MEGGEIGNINKDLENYRIDRGNATKIMLIVGIAGGMSLFIQACSSAEEKFIKEVKEEEEYQNEHLEEKERLEKLLPEYAKTNTIEFTSIGPNKTEVGTAFAFHQQELDDGKWATFCVTSNHLITKPGHVTITARVDQPQFEEDTVEQHSFEKDEFNTFRSKVDPDVGMIVFKTNYRLLKRFIKECKISNTSPAIGESYTSYSFELGDIGNDGVISEHKVVENFNEDEPNLKWCDGASSGQASGSPLFNEESGALEAVIIGREPRGKKYVGMSPVYKAMKRMIEGGPDVLGQTVNQCYRTNIKIDDMIREP